MLPEKDRVYINNIQHKDNKLMTVPNLTISTIIVILLIAFYKF